MNYRIFLNRRKPRAALLHFCLAAGLTLCQNQCFASSTASEAKLEQPTQATDARATDPDTEFAPGPLLERRKRLKRCIELAKGYGVGITGYLVHFNMLEKKVKAGASEAEILPLIEKIESTLNSQLKFDILALYDDKPGIKTAYLQKVLEFLAPTLDKIKKPLKGENLSISIDKNGNVKSIEPFKDSDATDKSISRIKALVRELGKFPPAPVENMALHLDIEGLPNKRHLCMYRGADYDNFMKSLQLRIKRNWTPFRHPENDTIEADFVIDKDGSITNIELTKPCQNQSQNQSAIDALHRASPIPLLPDGFVGSTRVNFTFDYKGK